MIVRAIVQKNTLRVHNLDAYNYQLIDFEGKEVRVTIKQWREIRSIEANAYYWAVVVKYVAQEVGMDTEETHQELARMFLTYTNQNTGRKYVKSTTGLDTKEFDVYLKKCVEWAGEFLYVEIPPPSDDPWWTALKSIKRKLAPQDWSPTPNIFT